MQQQSQTSRPIPPRYCWLKRITLMVLVLFIILCGVRWWWGVVADRHLQAEIDLIKARGEPLYLEDFAVEPIPDEDNAAKALEQAMAIWDDTNAETGDDRQYLADNAKALALIREARSRPGCDWGFELTGPAIDMVLPGSRQSRKLAQYIQEAAVRQHQLHNDFEAIELLYDLLFIAEAHDHYPPLLFNVLISWSIDAIAINAIENIAPKLMVGNQGSGGHASTRKQIDTLIEKLLDDLAERKRFQTAVFGERGIAQLGFVRTLRAGRVIILSISNPLDNAVANPSARLGYYDRSLSFIVEPMLILNIIQEMRYTTAAGESVEQSNWHQARMQLLNFTSNLTIRSTKPKQIMTTSIFS